jgi:dynein light chain Tctex-type 1
MNEDFNDAGPQNFEYDEVKLLIDQAIEPVLGQSVYQPKKVHGWCSQVVEGALKNLQTAAKPFKYVVTCIIMQKNGAGLHTASTCYWDTLTDGSCSVRWENSTMHAIVTVFALHI